jgi:hypothetical protein
MSLRRLIFGDFGAAASSRPPSRPVEAIQIGGLP